MIPDRTVAHISILVMITMTTDFQVSFIENVRHADDWPMFKQTEYFHLSVPISVLSISVRHPGLAGQAMKDWKAQQFRNLLSTICAELSLKTEVFIANRGLRPNTPIYRYKKLWRSSELLHAPSDLKHNNELLLECEKGLRFSGSALVEPHHLDWLSMYMVDNSFAIPLLSDACQQLTITRTLEMTKAAFPPDGCGGGLLPDGFDWPSFSNWCIQNDIICFRKNLFSDGIFIAFDLFGSQKRLALLNKYFSN
jgi:hypothetical protein